MVKQGEEKARGLLKKNVGLLLDMSRGQGRGSKLRQWPTGWLKMQNQRECSPNSIRR